MKFVLYRDKAGEWRWSLRARNGRLVADGCEGYKTKRSAIDMCKKINPSIPREAV